MTVIASSDFREAMSRLASGVVLVTCEVNGRPWGVTISSCCSASMDPPQLLISLKTDTVAASAIAATQRFGVSLLAEESLDLANFGAAPGAPKFIDDFCPNTRSVQEPLGSPVPDGILHHLDCTVTQQLITGDHTAFVGTVRAAVPGERDKPLAYFARSFQRLQTAMARG